MKTKIKLILVILLISAGQIFAQNVYTVNASNYDISDNLDLKAVAYHFGKSKNLKKFEKTLNDPKKRISNLDLNDDGYIDYLRVIEANEGGVYLVIIQAVLGINLYQDVATIDVDVSDRHKLYVQIVGNEYIYGSNYIIEPVYSYRPDIYDYFRYPHHSIWYSPYTWNYYPSYYRYHRPYNVYIYHRHVYNNYHHVDCRYAQHRNYDHAGNYYKKEHRNDYENKHPEKSFNQRNDGIDNHRELVERRSTSPNTNNRRTDINEAPQSKTIPSTRTNTYSNDENSRRSKREDGTVPVAQPQSKSSTDSNTRKVYRSDTPSTEPSTKSRSSSESRRVYTAPESTQKSAPAVYTKPAETRSPSRSATERKPATVKQSRSESAKPAVKSEPSRRSSSESKSSVKQNKAETQKSKSTETKSSSRSSSSKSSTEKSNGSGRR